MQTAKILNLDQDFLKRPMKLLFWCQVILDVHLFQEIRLIPCVKVTHINSSYTHLSESFVMFNV